MSGKVVNSSLELLRKFCCKPTGKCFESRHNSYTLTFEKPSLHPYDVFPTTAFDAFRIGAFGLLPETATKPGGHYRNVTKKPQIDYETNSISIFDYHFSKLVQ